MHYNVLLHVLLYVNSPMLQNYSEPPEIPMLQNTQMRLHKNMQTTFTKK